MNDILIRKAEPKDFDAILNIMNYEILNKTSLYDYNERTIEDVEISYNSKKDKNFPFFVAEKDNEVIGYAYYDSFNPKQGYKFTVEHSIYLANGFEGLGLGKLLMVELINYAKLAEIKTMIGLIDNENLQSIAFHKKFGFTKVGVMQKVGYKFNKWLDCCIMQLHL